MLLQKNQVLVTEMPKGSEDPQPKKKLTADEIIDRLDSKMWSMVSERFSIHSNVHLEASVKRRIRAPFHKKIFARSLTFAGEKM